MHRQVLEAKIDDHAEAEPEEAEDNSDEEQVVPVDGAVQEADRGKVREFERGFSAGFSGGLSESGGSADGEQRGQGESLFQETVQKSAFQEGRDRATWFERSGGKPGTHNETSNR